MKRLGSTLRRVGMIGLAAVIASGCGGGDDAAVTPSTSPSTPPTPDANSGQSLTGDAGAAGAAGSETPGSVTAEIPDLKGGDVGGGLAAPKGGGSLFSPGATESNGQSEITPDSGAGSFDGGFSEGTTSFPTPNTDAPTVDASPTFGSARIYVDGVIHTVGIGEAFPKAAPVFRLLEIASGNIEVQLIAGEFTTGGGDGVMLDKGELVSLVNASEQLTYRIKYLRPISGSSGITM